ncbi:hypothetical protein TNCV_4856051 [Trichonephila clavipes]|nr:hypothetical protein TNCV_4856051 [Trichonephila clavipes]
MTSPAKEQNVLDSKCNTEFKIWWNEKYGIMYASKEDKAVCALCSGIERSGSAHDDPRLCHNSVGLLGKEAGATKIVVVPLKQYGWSINHTVTLTLRVPSKIADTKIVWVSEEEQMWYPTKPCSESSKCLVLSQAERKNTGLFWKIAMSHLGILLTPVYPI